MSQRRHFDAIVIGTGFDGAVTACLLVQAGTKICVLERGRRYAPNHLASVARVAGNAVDLAQPETVPSDFPDLPAHDRDLPSRARWRWDPGSDQFGLWDVRVLDGVQVAQAAGWGGGSL